jgi:hypothetical protein
VDDQGFQYPPNIATLWSDAELAAIGWKRPAPAMPSKASLRAYADMVEAVKNKQDITVNLTGDRRAVAATDADGRADILGVIAQLQIAGENATTVWHQTSGDITIDLADAIAIGNAVAGHRRSIVSARTQIDVMIESGAITSNAQIDAFNWLGA